MRCVEGFGGYRSPRQVVVSLTSDALCIFRQTQYWMTTTKLCLFWHGRMGRKGRQPAQLLATISVPVMIRMHILILASQRSEPCRVKASKEAQSLEGMATVKARLEIGDHNGGRARRPSKIVNGVAAPNVVVQSPEQAGVNHLFTSEGDLEDKWLPVKLLCPIF